VVGQVRSGDAAGVVVLQLLLVVARDVAATDAASMGLR